MVQLRRTGGRRLIVLSDDDEEGNTTKGQNHGESDNLSVTSTQIVPPPIASSQSTSDTPTPRSTPKKLKREAAPKTKSPDQSKTRTLHSFFNTTTERELQSSASLGNARVAPTEQKDEEDVIEDGVSDDDNTIESCYSIDKARFNSAVPRKRSADGFDPHGVIYGSQKYLKLSDRVQLSTPTTSIESDLRPWNEKYGPSELNELVVHKKKVAEVRNWLESSLHGHRHSRMLVLKSAAGSGKTSTLSMLSKALNFEIVEWRNPTSSARLTDDHLSLSAQFEDFLSRRSRFGSLAFVSASGLENEPDFEQEKREHTSDRQILLVEEFPSNLTRATLALQAFRSSVLHFLEADAHSNRTPLVMIISEAVISDSNSSIDNFTAHRLLGPEIISHPSVAMIEYNRVAPTFITRALNLALQKRRQHTKQAYEPSDKALKKLSEFGDVRNALSTLEFLCTRNSGDVQANLPTRPKTKPRAGKNKAKAPAPSSSTVLDEDLSIISLREASIGLFHAVGRVMYNKRTVSSDYIASSGTSSLSSVSDHLPQRKRNLTSEVDLDSLIDETGTDTSTFLSSLHENYILSCFSPDGNSETTLDHIINCLESLADADLLSTTYSNSRGKNAITSELKQSELSFQVGVRGLLFNLPYPVKRQAPQGRSKADAYRMFYPSILKLWKKKEENQGLIDFFVQKALSGTLVPHSARQRKGAMMEKSMGSSKVSFQMSELDVSGEAQHGNSTSDNRAQLADETDAIGLPGIVGSAQSAREEMLLERMPYMKRIFAQNYSMIGSLLLEQMDQITQFTGVGMLQEEDEDVDAADVPAPKGNYFQSQNRKDDRETFFGSHRSERGGLYEDSNAADKLVLSDDDIEDD